MKKFVEVFLGSRGILEEVNLVETDLTKKEYYDNYVEGIICDLEEMSEDEEDLEFMKEFVECIEYSRFLMVGLNEEEYLMVFDFEDNEELCNKLLELYENGDEEGIRDIVDSMEW